MAMARVTRTATHSSATSFCTDSPGQDEVTNAGGRIGAFDGGSSIPVLITHCSIPASATARIQTEVWVPGPSVDASGLPVTAWKASEAAP